MRFLAAKKNNLLKRQTILIDQYNDVSDKLNNTLNPSDPARLKAQLRELEEEILKVEGELGQVTLQIEQQAQGGLRASKEFESRLPSMDYRQALDLAEGVFKRLEQKEGGALFLVQRSSQMKGDWCLTAVKKLLTFKAGEGGVIPRQLGFTALDTPSEIEFLHKLAKMLGPEPVAADPEAAMQTVIQKLCGSIPWGGALYVEVRFTDPEALSPALLRWIVERFWCAFADSLPALASEKPRFMVILTLVVEGLLPRECLAKHLGCLDPAFDFKKILELPLEPWTVDDIQVWLEQSSGLRLRKEQCKRIAETVYRTSEKGIPSFAQEALLKELELLAGAET